MNKYTVYAKNLKRNHDNRMIRNFILDSVSIIVSIGLMWVFTVIVFSL